LRHRFSSRWTCTREAEDGTVALRRRDGEQQVLALDAAIAALKAEAAI
jgi:hypothetical protein